MADMVSNIVIDRLLSFISKSGELPWECPWRYQYAINYTTCKPYTGINRWLLPVGEYLTFNQFNKFNSKAMGIYCVKPDAEWHIVFFVDRMDKDITLSDIPITFRDEALKHVNGTSPVLVGRHYSYSYYAGAGKYTEAKSVKRYYNVAERKDFVDGCGLPLPSRVGEAVEVTMTKPRDIVSSYMSQHGISLTEGFEARYNPTGNCISMPSVGAFTSEALYFGVLFHEIIHSTGHASCLSRRDIVERKNLCKSTESVSREELVAEFGAALLCAEAGICEYTSENSKAFLTRASYIQAWVKYFKESPSDIIFIASEAEKACNFVLSSSLT